MRTVKLVGDVVRRGLSLGRRRGCKDDLINLRQIARTSQQIGNAQLFWPNAIHRRQCAVEHVIDAIIAARPIRPQFA